jgi:peptide/nickel transport system permease protein
MAPVIVISAANFISYISGKRFKLSGFRCTAPIPSWGIKDHYSYIILGKPYLAMVPGVALCLHWLFFDDEML